LTKNLLKKGFQVTVYDSLLFNQTSLFDCCHERGFNFVRGDIADEATIGKLLKEFDIIIPLAAIVGAPGCARNPALTRLVNYDAPLKMLEQLSFSQMVLFPTTNSGYGIGGAGEYCDENSPLRPISDYARTKVEIEDAFLQKGNAVTFRLATVFGVSPRMRMDLLVNDFVYRAIRDRFIVLFEEKFRRNYIHIRDVAKAFGFGIDRFDKMRGEPFNVGLSSANLTKRELCENIRVHIPKLEIFTSDQGKDPDQRDYLISNAKIESLGWSADYSLDDGIKELITGYQILRPNIFSNV
jgi:nucleoside-diphosphate-sugar epimerase